MARRETPKPTGIRRAERWAVGLAMAIVAFVLERIVMRSVKKKRGGVEQEPMPTTMTSKGSEVDLE
jgi:hypothetical protein